MVFSARVLLFVLVTALLAAPVLAPVQAQEARHDTWVELDQGNIDLSVVDGTALSLAPGTHIAVAPAKAEGEITHIKVHKGQLHVSNVFHRHADIIHIQLGEHTFALRRGSALISHLPDARHVTLLHGHSIAALGHPTPLTQPGMRMTPGADGMRQHAPEPEALQRMLRATGGPGGPGPGGTGAPQPGQHGVPPKKPRPGQQPKRSEAGPQLLPAPGQGGTPLSPAQLNQRGTLNNIIEAQQGAAPPPSGGGRPPRPPRPPMPPPRLKPPKKP